MTQILVIKIVKILLMLMVLSAAVKIIAIRMVIDNNNNYKINRDIDSINNHIKTNQCDVG